MIIDARLAEGYVVICSSHHDSHSFLVKQLGPNVICQSTDLIVASSYHRGRRTVLRCGLLQRVGNRRYELLPVPLQSTGAHANHSAPSKGQR